MIHLGPAIRALLTDSPGAGAAVYAARAPQDVRAPFLIYQQIVREGFADSLDGAGSLVQASVQIDSYAETLAAAHALATAVRGILNGYRGTVGYGADSPQPTVRIGACRLTNQIDLPDTDGTPRLFRVMQEYLITFDET